MATETEIDIQIAKDKQYIELTKRAKKEICAECENPLLVRYINGNYELSCGKNDSHVGTKPNREHSVLKEREARQMVSDNKQMELAKYASSVTLDKSEAQEIILSLWPDAPITEVAKAAMICNRYGLNPLMKHLFLVKYERREKAKQVNGVWEKGKLIGDDWSIQLAITATRMIARRSGPWSYVDDTPRLMSEDEQIKILGGVEKDKFWAITKLRGKDGMTAQGYGNFPRDAKVQGADKGNTPQNMAFIRSERAAIDKLHPEKLPAGIGVIDSEYEDVQIVNPATGEIKEGEKAKQVTQGEIITPPAVPKVENTPAKTPEPPPEGTQGAKVTGKPVYPKISADRVDQLSRALTAAGYLPGELRESLFRGMKIVKMAELDTNQGDLLEAFCKRKEAEKDMKLPFEEGE